MKQVRGLWISIIFVLVPVLAAGTPIAETILNVAYPVFDVVLEFAPAVFIVLVVRQFGGGRLAWPWFVVALGVMVQCSAQLGRSGGGCFGHASAVFGHVRHCPRAPPSSAATDPGSA